jgi:membrane peptidoglycan carboxypeptidase
VATIHLPRGVIATRLLSPVNPHFRPLDSIDPLLVAAVVTNEDGGFYRHRGFNTEAVKGAIAENLKAGAYRRGARDHHHAARPQPLSRPRAHPVAQGAGGGAGVDARASDGVSKRRLLEIYLNIIEWGPGVHGADEATWFYFDHDAGTSHRR